MIPTRVAALGGVIGPVIFVGAWITGNVVTNRDYSPVDDAISRLAAVGADSRPVMTAGFIGFGVSLPIFAVALRHVLAGPAWVAAATTGIATIGVAATPLDHSDTVDMLHGIAATSGYVALVATPLLAARALRADGHDRLAIVGLLAASVSTVSLVLSSLSDANGLFQRIGLTATDAWIVLTAILIADRRVG